jgi:hypothetical protein
LTELSRKLAPDACSGVGDLELQFIYLFWQNLRSVAAGRRRRRDWLLCWVGDQSVQFISLQPLTIQLIRNLQLKEIS